MKRKALALLLAIPLLLLCACAEQSEHGTAMDTYYGIRIQTGSSKDLMTDLRDTVTLLGFYADPYENRSDIYALNTTGQCADLLPEIAALLKLAQLARAKTGGAFDPFLWPLVQLWDINSLDDDWQPPTDEAVTEALRLCREAQLTGLNGTVTLAPSGAGVDLGAIAKGYAVDAWLQQTRETGADHCLFDFGGTFGAIGTKRDGQAWQIGLRDPLGTPSAVFATLTMDDDCLATSSTVFRHQTFEGVQYGHILDPKTGRPADAGLISVSIVGPSAAVCDILSTAVYVLGQEAGLAMMQREYPGYAAILVNRDNGVYVSPEIQNRLVLTEGEYHLQP